MFEEIKAFILGLEFQVPSFLPPILLGLAAGLGAYSIVKLIIHNRPHAKEMEVWRDRPPFLFRLFKPIILLFSNVVKELMSERYSQVLRGRLSAAGLSYAIMPEEFVTLKVVCSVVSFVLVFSVYQLSSTLGPEALIVLAMVIMLGLFYPDIWLSDRIGHRRRLVSKDFPFLLDLLVLSMQAGLNYSSSLAQAIASLPAGPVKEEFAKLLREIRAGKSRREALQDLANRMDISTIYNFVGAMNQAEETGGEIVRVLAPQAEQRRSERFNIAEEMASKAPVKMLIPMMAFLFPIFFMLIAFVIVVKLAEIDALPVLMMRLLMT